MKAFSLLDVDAKFVHNPCNTIKVTNILSGYYPSYDADVEFFLQADVYSYGMVLAFCLTSESPWSSVETAILKDEEDWDPHVAKIALPEKLSKNDIIREIIENCYAEDTSVRPRTAREVIERYFRGQSGYIKTVEPLIEATSDKRPPTYNSHLTLDL